jgi:assimilatory nitrate reductase catalytic subunit
VLRYADRRKGQRRAMHLVRQHSGTRLEGFLLAGDTRAESWIKILLQDELPAESYGRLLLAPGATAPKAIRSRGRQICTCLNVTHAAIDEQLAAGTGGAEERMASLQASLTCGTSCGSCVPELRRMVQAFMAPGPADGLHSPDSSMS